MNRIEEVKKILANRINRTDGVLEKISELNDIAPILQNLKEEDITSLRILDTIPEDVAEELSPTLLSYELVNDTSILENFPDIRNLSPKTREVLLPTTSGTSTPYIVSVTRIIDSISFDPDLRPNWAEEVTIIMDEHSQIIEQRNYLPERLDIINRDLGKKFNIAMRSFNKCKIGITSVDLAAIHLRDILEDVWGGLANLARDKSDELRLNGIRLERRKERHREMVSDILATNNFPKNKLLNLLFELDSLCYKLSDKKFGKNPLNKDFPLLNLYYTRWLSIIDGISGIVV